MPAPQRQIAVLYTGGTIGMVQSAHGLAPAADLAARVPPALSGSLCLHWHQADPLIDSSALTLADWARWLAWLRQHLPDYDGALVLHGTDTLAYTANLLAMALSALDKPVVLTGAQWPFGAAHSDAPHNLATALAALARPGWQQVALAFDGHLYRAVGSSKVSTESAAGFDTPHFPPLGRWQADDGWQTWQPGRAPAAPNYAPPRLNERVRIVCHTLTPGANSAMIADSLTRFAADGVVLESYGHGNAPDDAALMAALHEVCRRGLPVINVSQVPQGCAAAVYAQGHALRQAGVISGGRANRETALALLTLAASNGWSHADIRAQLRHWRLTD